MSEQSSLEINWFNVVGAAMGAVSAAVVLSTLGTAGTLIGAALGSLCITVGGAVYAHSIRVTQQRVVATRAMLARASAHRVDDGPRTRRLEVPEEGVEQSAKGSRMQVLRQVLRSLPWKRIVAASAALFVIAMAVIVVFEMSTGRPLSSFTGGTSDTDSGTSVPGIGGRGGESGPTDGPTDGPADPAAPSQEPPEDQGEDPEEQDPVLPAEEEPVPTEESSTEPAPTTPPAESQDTAP